MASNDRPLIRFSTCLLLPALLAACERTPPTDEHAATAAIPEAAVVAEPAPAVAPAPAVLAQSFSTDDPRIGTEVGERSLGLGLGTTGKAGWLMFGPYIPLPAGNYQVALQGSAQEGHAGVVHVDVAQGKGTEVLAAADLEAPALMAPPSPDGLMVLPFTLKEASDNLEVRIRVTEASKLSISGFVIRAVP